MKLGFRIFAALAGVCVLQSGCAPEQVPFGAMPKSSLKAGVIWYWQHQVDGGCVDWMANEKWVSTRIAVNAACTGRDRKAIFDAPGAGYSSTFDELTFSGYFEWTPEIWSEQIVFDDEGMWKETKPCPSELTQMQLDGILAIARDAQAEARTPQELAVLKRIEERLAATDGTNLASAPHGCQHRPNDEDWKIVRKRPNPWEVGS